MGHYGSTPPSHALQAASSVYEQFKSHSSSTRTDTNLILTETIRIAHPDEHITTIASQSCDLLSFAKASDSISQLTYTPPSSRLEGGDGTLAERISFGLYDISYLERTFQFYIVEWVDRLYGRVKNYYILSSKSDVDATGHDAVVDHLLLAAGKWTSELHNEIYVFDSGRWVKNAELWTAVQSSSWDDVILHPAMKETLISDVQGFFDSRAVYEEYAVPWKRGVIVHGTPGCGKTISIKALMNSLQKREPKVESLYVKSFDACQGPQYSIRTIFQQARNMAPCLLIFEDLDSLVVDQVRSYFLNEVDGLEDNNGILMIGSTNHLERLDPGISKRPSRFDRKYHYKLPSERERILYCEYWKKKLEKNSNIDFDPEICDVVAKLTEGFSFAYLKELFVQTLLTIVGGGENDSEAELEKTAEQTKIVKDSTKLAIGDEKTSTTAESIKDQDESTNNAPAGDGPDPTPTKPTMPEVEISKHLLANPLMRILQKQALALWKDMDNSKDEEIGPKIPGGAQGARGLRRALRTMAVAGR